MPRTKQIYEYNRIVNSYFPIKIRVEDQEIVCKVSEEIPFDKSFTVVQTRFNESKPWLVEEIKKFTDQDTKEEIIDEK